MSSLMLRKEITTPSGFKCTIRKLNLLTFLKLGVEGIPDLFIDSKSALAQKIKNDPKNVLGILEICVFDGIVGSELIESGKKYKIVKSLSNVSFEDLANYSPEILPEEIPNQDLMYILEQIFEFSGLMDGSSKINFPEKS